jgi:hypothetical protein
VSAGVVLFLALGAGAGALQATLLARAARPRRGSLGGLARVLVVGAMLVLAARSAHLGAATLGWLVGALANGVREYRRLL